MRVDRRPSYWGNHALKDHKISEKTSDYYSFFVISWLLVKFKKNKKEREREKKRDVCPAREIFVSLHV
jgi:hypothetical protein